MPGDVIQLRDERAEESRKAVLKQLQIMRKLTVKEVRNGVELRTPAALEASVKIVLSAREAFSLVRVLGPIGLQNGDGSFTRLFAAMATCQTHLMRAPEGKSISVVAALQVLQVAINDHLWACREVEDPPRRAHRKKPPARRASERG